MQRPAAAVKKRPAAMKRPAAAHYQKYGCSKCTSPLQPKSNVAHSPALGQPLLPVTPPPLPCLSHPLTLATHASSFSGAAIMAAVRAASKHAQERASKCSSEGSRECFKYIIKASRGFARQHTARKAPKVAFTLLQSYQSPHSKFHTSLSKSDTSVSKSHNNRYCK